MSLLCYIGLITILVVVAKVGLFVYQSLVYKSTSVKKFLTRDYWAVVTGATAGIGEGFTYELARRGINVLAVSRSEDKLKNLAQQVSSKYPSVQVKTLVIDFANESPEEYSNKLKDAIANLKVSVLVNNVGVNNKDNKPFMFLDQDNEDFKSLVNVNVTSTLFVTKAVMPKIVENGSKVGGLVLNLGSYTGKYPLAMNAVYSATKSFVDVWSRSLNTEYASKGIRVLSLLPMYVKSNMTQIRKTSLMVCDGQKLASDTLNAVDAPLLPTSFSPYIVHRALMAIFSLLPEQIIAGQGLKTMIAVRRKMDARSQRNATTEQNKKQE